MGLTHYIIPKSSDQSQGVQQVNPRHHGLQLKKRAQLNTWGFFLTLGDP